MDKEVQRIDTEEFITAVEKYPAIWDSTKDEYSDKLAKRLAWSEVIKTFFEDFEDMEPARKKSLGSLIQRKWKSLRDSFSREIAKQKQDSKLGAAASTRKPYVFFDQLKFLQTATKNTTNSLADDGNSDGNVEEEEVDLPPKNKRNKKITKDIQNDVTFRRSLKKQYLQETGEANDEDQLFMMSLVGELKRVPDYMKLDVKTKLMAVFVQARSEHQRNYAYYANPVAASSQYYNQHPAYARSGPSTVSGSGYNQACRYPGESRPAQKSGEPLNANQSYPQVSTHAPSPSDTFCPRSAVSPISDIDF